MKYRAMSVYSRAMERCYTTFANAHHRKDIKRIIREEIGHLGNRLRVSVEEDAIDQEDSFYTITIRGIRSETLFSIHIAMQSIDGLSMQPEDDDDEEEREEAWTMSFDDPETSEDWKTSLEDQREIWQDPDGTHVRDDEDGGSLLAI